MVTPVRFYSVLLFAFYLSLSPCSVSSMGRQQMSPAEKAAAELQERYNSLSAPGIIMLPINGISAVPSDILGQIERELLVQMINAGKLKPIRMQNWLLTTYANKAPNPFAVINGIRAEEYSLPLQYIGKPFLYRGGNKYYFALHVYPLQSYYPIVILRQFNVSGAFDRIIPELVLSCIEELNIQLSKPPPANARKRVVVDDFKLDFYKLAELSSGEFDFIPVPFFEAEGMALREGDDIFSRMMGYILATTGMFQVFPMGDFKEYSNSVIGGSTTSLVDYRIQGRVLLSDKECVLYVDVVDVRTGANIVSSFYPLLTYSFNDIWKAYREMSVQIVSGLFDHESFGIVPTLSYTGRSFFSNNMFVGWNSLENFILPRGLHVLSSGSSLGLESSPGSRSFYYVLLDYQSFVYPEREGKRLWNLLRK